jgi:hypothetical protein
MSGAINFDDELGATAQKVDDVGGNDDLTSKLEALESPVTKHAPKKAFGSSADASGALRDGAASPHRPLFYPRQRPLIRPSRGTFSP